MSAHSQLMPRHSPRSGLYVYCMCARLAHQNIRREVERIGASGCVRLDLLGPLEQGRGLSTNIRSSEPSLLKVENHVNPGEKNPPLGW